MDENWLNTPLIIETRHGNLEGTIKYGVRLPIRPGNIPLQECEANSREKIEGEKPAYWFVNESQSVKVKLLTQSLKKDRITGLGKDVGIFKYTIKKIN